LILPSHQENFGLVVAEALALGTPALLTRQINIWREVVESGAGFAEADTPTGARALLKVAANWTPGERQALGTKAQACFATHFRIEETARRLHTLLKADLGL
jgi:glycosyltransferase involved in cell wall biosynthesis